MPRIQIQLHSDFFCPLLAHADARFWHNTVNSIRLQLVSVRAVYNNDDVACKTFLELCVCFGQCCFNAPCFSNLHSIPFFIPSAPLSNRSCNPADTRKHLSFFQSALCSEQKNKYHTETGSAPAKHLPEFTENTTPDKGLQVKFCLWDQAQLLRPPQQCHPSAGPSCLLLWERLPHTQTYLCGGLDLRHTGFVPGGLLLLNSSEEQNPWGFIFGDGEMHDRTLFLALLFGLLDLPVLSYTTSLWCHPMPSVLQWRGNQHRGTGRGLRKHLLFTLSPVILLMQHSCPSWGLGLSSSASLVPAGGSPSAGMHNMARGIAEVPISTAGRWAAPLTPQSLKSHWPKERGRKAFLIATVRVRRKQNLVVHVLWNWY